MVLDLSTGIMRRSKHGQSAKRSEERGGAAALVNTDVVPALSSLAIGDANAVGETGSRRKVASPSEERRLDSGRAIMHAGGDSVKAATCKHEHLEQV